MSCRVTTVLCRNMKRNWSEARSTFCESTKRSMMSGIGNEQREREREIEEGADGEGKRESTTSRDQYGVDSDGGEGENGFKKVFKYYKRRVPPPSLDDVIDPSKPSISSGLSLSALSPPPSFSLSPHDLSLLAIRPLSEWKVATLSGREGLYILPNILREDGHSLWLKRVAEYAEGPSTTNLSKGGGGTGSNVLLKAGKSLRWTTLGVEYDWDSKEYPERAERELPEELRRMAEVISLSLGLGPVHADAAIVNYYPPKSTLSPHVDRSERVSAPLVSLSLGQSAVYLTGSAHLQDPPLPLLLQSGDVLVMHSEQRFVYHGVPLILSNRPFSIEKDAQLEKYANQNRVNITIRQVNPSLSSSSL